MYENLHEKDIQKGSHAIEHASGVLHVTTDGATIEHLVGRHGQAVVNVNGSLSVGSRLENPSQAIPP